MFEPIAPLWTSTAATAAAVILALGAAGCQRDTVTPEPRPRAAEPSVVSPSPVLDRIALLQALDKAASAYATGQDRGGPLTGRRFLVRQAFGCADPRAAENAPEDGLGGLSWADERQSLKATLTPADWTASPLLASEADVWELVEGFWLTRPWLRAEGCPAPRSDAPEGEASAPSSQSMGLAAIFARDGDRTGRRNGRAYEFVVRGEGDQPPKIPTQGYRLVVEGRIAAFADGSSLRCYAEGLNQRPVCIAAVQLDRVAFEDAAGGLLTEWRSG